MRRLAVGVANAEILAEDAVAPPPLAVNSVRDAAVGVSAARGCRTAVRFWAFFSSSLKSTTEPCRPTIASPPGRLIGMPSLLPSPCVAFPGAAFVCGEEDEQGRGAADDKDDEHDRTARAEDRLETPTVKKPTRR